MNETDDSLRRDAQQVMNNLGGPTKAARLLVVKPSSICAWRKKGIPKAWVRYFQAVMPHVLAGTRWQVQTRAKKTETA